MSNANITQAPAFSHSISEQYEKHANPVNSWTQFDLTHYIHITICVPRAVVFTIIYEVYERVWILRIYLLTVEGVIGYVAFMHVYYVLVTEPLRI